MCNRFPGDGVEVYSVDSMVLGKKNKIYRLNFWTHWMWQVSQLTRWYWKPRMPVMLLRNQNPDKNLCNGTRHIVQSVSGRLHKLKHVKLGTVHFLPRLKCLVDDMEMPFQWQRRQFPVRNAFSMTINKSQGQTLKGKCGAFLPASVFSHGQLY